MSNANWRRYVLLLLMKLFVRGRLNVIVVAWRLSTLRSLCGPLMDDRLREQSFFNATLIFTQYLIIASCLFCLKCLQYRFRTLTQINDFFIQNYPRSFISVMSPLFLRISIVKSLHCCNHIAFLQTILIGHLHRRHLLVLVRFLSRNHFLMQLGFIFCLFLVFVDEIFSVNFFVDETIIFTKIILRRQCIIFPADIFGWLQQFLLFLNRRIISLTLIQINLLKWLFGNLPLRGISFVNSLVRLKSVLIGC